MSEDLNETIKQISNLLGKEEMPENIKGLLSLFADSMSDNSSSQKGEANDTKNKNEPKSDPPENIDMIRKVATMMNRSNLAKDPRIALLQAIKPFLNNRRQSRLDNCVEILRMSGLAKLLDEDEKGS